MGVAGHPYEFEIDRDLDAYSHCEFTLLLDNGVLFGRDPKHRECVSINETGKLVGIPRCDRVLGVSGNGATLYEYAGERAIVRAARGGFVELVAPPTAKCLPTCISLSGYVGGTFTLRDETHPAIWTDTGSLVTEIVLLGSIVGCAPNSDNWFYGYLRGVATVWGERRPQPLQVLPGEIVHLHCVNSGGLVGGDLLGHPALWNANGARVRLPIAETESGAVRHLTEDGCLVLELHNDNRSRFLFGRPNDLIAIEDLLPGMLRGLYVKSVDAVSPSGRMLITCSLDPDSVQNKVQVLLVPKALRDEENLRASEGRSI